MTYARFGMPLSPRERQCLDGVARGEPYKVIAAQIGLSERTVQCHLNNARTKLGASTQYHAVMMAYHGAARVMVEGDL
jgi:LuxR family transcriptional activator of conjugal transfer of Ti plasmids